MRLRSFFGLVLAVALVAVVSSCSLPPKPIPTAKISATASATTSDSPTPSESANPLPSEEPGALKITELGEDACNTYLVCTYITVDALKACANPTFTIDLFDENDEDYDSEEITISRIKAGAHLANIELGTDDDYAEYVELSDYTCGTA